MLEGLIAFWKEFCLTLSPKRCRWCGEIIRQNALGRWCSQNTVNGLYLRYWCPKNAGLEELKYHEVK